MTNCKNKECNNTFSKGDYNLPPVKGANDYCPKCRRKYILSHAYSSKKTSWKFKKTTPQKPRKSTPRQRAIKLADTYFSLYVRLANSSDGVCKCYTCQKPIPWKSKNKTTHLGHFISRSHFMTRWYYFNAKPQCATCNSYQDGRKFEFRNNLIKQYGKPFVERMEERALIQSNYSEKDIRRIGDIYRNKFNFISDRKNKKKCK